jgi:hypothetical protein
MPEPAIHTELLQPPFIGQDQLFGRPRTRKHLLGERWSVVGGMRFLADHDQPARKAPGAEGLGGPESTQAGPDDHHGSVGGQRAAHGRAHWPNMASHCAAERGARTKLVRRVSPMVAEGAGEY